MPREYKKRGRRDEKKRKRDLQDVEPATKRRRPSPPTERNERQEQDYVSFATGANAESNELHGREDVPADSDETLPFGPAAPVPPDSNEFYGILSSDDQAYFKRADAMLELDNFGSPEERRLFLASVWREAAAKELKLACAQTCSRILERLVKVSSSKELKRLWLSFKGHFLFLVQHRFASHVCEALFLKTAPLVTQELVSGTIEDAQEDGEEEEPEEDESAKVSMETLFLEAVEELSENMGYLMTDRFASHALRVLLVVLGGKPLDDNNTTHTIQSKNKEHIELGIPNASASAATTRDSWRTVPGSFHSTLQKMASSTIGSLDSHYLRALATHPIGNPVLQLLLELEFNSLGKQGTRSSPDSLFRRLLPDDPPTEDTQSASFIKGLLYDPVGSRLLETIVQHAPGKTFKSIYRALFRDELPNILRNEVASFVCTRIIERLGQEDLRQAVEKISPEVKALIDRRRHSVLRVLVERCRVRELDIKPLAEAFRATFGAPNLQTLSRVLLAQSEPENVEDGQGKAPNHSPQKLHASLLVQTILGQGDQLRDYFNAIFVEATPGLVTIACDRQATHALQAVLTAPRQDQAVKRKLVQAFSGHATELATDTIGSHVLDAIWKATDGGLFFLREQFAEELVRNEAQIRDSFSGRGVWRTWALDLYQRRKDAWITRMKRGEEGPEGATSGPPPREKTAIDKARERFAASSKHRRKGPNRDGLIVRVK